MNINKSMPKYIITTCPHCQKEFEKEVIQMDFIVKDPNFRSYRDGTLTRRVDHTPKQNLEECPLCH